MTSTSANQGVAATSPKSSVDTTTGAAAQRPLAYEDGDFYWNIQRVPDGPTDPGRTHGIFVVHGMGQQHWTETAAQLRAGFEDAFEEIAAWQNEHRDKAKGVPPAKLPPPFIYEGYWADYPDVAKTFPDDWAKFNEREKDFFGNLWTHRVVSGSRTFRWVFRQQLRLLNPKVRKEVGFSGWLLYLPLQVVSTSVLIFLWFRYRKAITDFLNDVRLYVEPEGVVERAIVQRIDYRVGEEFLRMVGLDWEFRPLPLDKQIEAGGQRLCFTRIVWVAHSLGTVVSYNVLSSLFHRAAGFEQNGDPAQKEGVARFRAALTRFVTMGSPLDKIAFLFGKETLKPWPSPTSRRALLLGGEALTDGQPPASETEWWVNFYHVLDPVSGALNNSLICGSQPPSNLHIRSGLIPGLAHQAYWTDSDALRFILGRTYGARLLPDKEYRPLSPAALTRLAMVGYWTWALLLFGAAFSLIWWGPELLRAAVKAGFKWMTG